MVIADRIGRLPAAALAMPSGHRKRLLSRRFWAWPAGGEAGGERSALSEPVAMLIAMMLGACQQDRERNQARRPCRHHSQQKPLIRFHPTRPITTYVTIMTKESSYLVYGHIKLPLFEVSGMHAGYFAAWII